jgi:hypothetical protein
MKPASTPQFASVYGFDYETVWDEESSEAECMSAAPDIGAGR